MFFPRARKCIITVSTVDETRTEYLNNSQMVKNSFWFSHMNFYIREYLKFAPISKFQLVPFV